MGDEEDMQLVQGGRYLENILMLMEGQSLELDLCV